MVMLGTMEETWTYEHYGYYAMLYSVAVGVDSVTSVYYMIP